MLKYQLDKTFGPVGAPAGIFLFVIGWWVTIYSLFGIFLILIGAFIGFTSTHTWIDVDKKRMKFSSTLFGVIPTGQWTEIQPDMKIGVKKSNKVWRGYSKGNRAIDIPDTDYRLILFDSNGKEIMPIRKTNHLDAALSQLEILSKQLGIGKFKGTQPLGH